VAGEPLIDKSSTIEEPPHPSPDHIIPNEGIKEAATRINEGLIKKCLKDEQDYWYAANVLRYASKTIGLDWVKVRDANLTPPEIVVPQPEPTGSTAGDA
jgi:hypothetical protein